MPIRTTTGAVCDVIETSLTGDAVLPFIRTASLLVDEHLAPISPALGASLLKEIETYLAAHFITLYEPRVKREDGGSVGFSYEGAAKDGAMGLSSSRYGQTAMMLDPSGTLSALNSEKRQAFIFRVGNERDVED